MKLWFMCRKCQSEICIESLSKNLKDMISGECPECGEYGYLNWILESVEYKKKKPDTIVK